MNMTREEEMWKSVENEHGVLSKREAFVALTAMEWADETMIDKACEWLRKMLINNADEVHDEPYVISKIHDFKDEFISDFRRTMEE